MAKYKKPGEDELKKRLEPHQYEVTQHDATEPPFQNEFWNNKSHGIYVDVASGEPLFSSLDKFDSGSGWPSFTCPLDKSNVVEKNDNSHMMVRTEVRSKHGDSHLGHLFDDGPGPNGLRYCINSASLRFIPVDKLEEEGYGEYVALFEKAAKEDGAQDREEAVFAAGCFWGVEEIIRGLHGVIDTEVGYTGGTLENPTYEDVTTGRTGHAEALRIVFDPREISYEDLLDYFYRLHDPTTKNRQGNDVGSQYRSAVFYHNEAQKEKALAVTERIKKSGKWHDEIVTEIAPAGPFYSAEDYHQDYLQKNPGGYHCHYLRD